MENPSGRTGPALDDAVADGARSDLEVAFYPDRLERGAAPISLSPSQAVRYAEDPARAEEAARTAGSRQVVEHVSLAALWSESGTLDDAVTHRATPGVPSPVEPDLEIAVPITDVVPAPSAAPEADRSDVVEPAAAAPPADDLDDLLSDVAQRSHAVRAAMDPERGSDAYADAGHDVQLAPDVDHGADVDPEPDAEHDADADAPDGSGQRQPWYAAAAADRRPWWRRLFGRRR